MMKIVTSLAERTKKYFTKFIKMSEEIDEMAIVKLLKEAVK